MDEKDFDRFVMTLPRYLRGQNARRVIRNMANGGAKLRTFMRNDLHHGGVAWSLDQVANALGAKPRTLTSRTALGIITKQAENA